MTTTEALAAIRLVGTVENASGRLMLRFPASAGEDLKPAIDALQANKDEILKLLLRLGSSDTVQAAHDILNRNGVRLLKLNDLWAVGIWSDLDGVEIRKAILTLGMDKLPVTYLDGEGVTVRYKVRRVVGVPIPTSVLREMKKTC